MKWTLTLIFLCILPFLCILDHSSAVYAGGLVIVALFAEHIRKF